jgi:hypothetical protein
MAVRNVGHSKPLTIITCVMSNLVTTAMVRYRNPARPVTVAMRPRAWMYLYPRIASRAVAAPKMRMPTAGASTPSIRLIAWPESTVPVDANPTYIRITRARGITAPYA